MPTRRRCSVSPARLSPQEETSSERPSRSRDSRLDATGALVGLLWRRGLEAELELVASVGAPGSAEPLVAAQVAADRALVGRHAVSVESVSALPGAATVSATLQLGQPPLGALQLLFARDTEAGDVDLATLATFGVRAAHALRASRHARSVELELGRTRALLGVVGQAISQLSLAHTLETAVARVGELLEADRLAVYLREDDRLYAAAGLGLAGPHARLAERLLDLTLGPFRSRGMRRRRRRLRGSTFVGRCATQQRRRGSRPRSRCRCSRGTRSSGCSVCSHPPAASSPRTSRHCWPRSPRSWRWRCRTRSCTSARSSSERSARRALEAERAASKQCARSTRSHVRSRRACPSKRLSRRSRGTIVEILGVDVASSACPTSAASTWCRGR